MLQSLALCLLNPCITPSLFILQLKLEEVYLPMVYQGQYTGNKSQQQINP